MDAAIKDIRRSIELLDGNIKMRKERIVGQVKYIEDMRQDNLRDTALREQYQTILQTLEKDNAE